MATNETLKNALLKRLGESETNLARSNLRALLSNEETKEVFSMLLKEKAPQYIEALIDLVAGDKELQSCHPSSIIHGAKVAATLNLSLDKALGYVYLTPKKDSTKFKLGYKGYLQLALRTGLYKNINVIKIYEGQLINWNPLTEELILDFNKKQSEAVIGYGATFELLNSFKKTVYWTREAMENQRINHHKNHMLWKSDYDAMAMTIVTRNMLGKWGVLSPEMERAFMEEAREESKVAEEVIINSSVKPLESKEAIEKNKEGTKMNKALKSKNPKVSQIMVFNTETTEERPMIKEDAISKPSTGNEVIEEVEEAVSKTHGDIGDLEQNQEHKVNKNIIEETPEKP